ncbi:MAG: dihydromonapterin reductase [Thiotrichales bacterium]|nr:dihydromonapterin reductase [Thiotrichales bacterium]
MQQETWQEYKDAVLITGASQRVGLYLARQFLAQARYPLIVTYRTWRPEIADLQARGALAIPVDFNQPQAVKNLIETLQQQVISLRALIHNASIWVTDAQIAAQPDLYAQLFAVHVQAPYQLNFALAPLLQKTTQGVADIISLSDANCDLNRQEYIAYLSSKAALQHQMRVFASKLAPQIKVNDIAPGLLLFHAHDSAEFRAQRLAKQLLPLEPGAEVIWQAVNFLMDNPYMTGVSVPVDGGVRFPKS